MTIIEYFKLNKRVSKLVIKILGIVFTIILAIIFMIFSMDNKRELIDAFYLFLICFVLGNFLALTLFSLMFALGYSKLNSQFKLYSKIPTDLKETLSLELFYKPLNSKFSFVEINIIGYENNSFIHFEYNTNDGLVWISIRNIMNDIEDFNAKQQEINYKYKKDSIFLSGFGLKKEIKWNYWNKLTEDEVKEQIINLYRISEIENIRVEKMYYNINWPEYDGS